MESLEEILGAAYTATRYEFDCGLAVENTALFNCRELMCVISEKRKSFSRQFTKEHTLDQDGLGPCT
jgi:hypothetical protein